MSFVAIDSETHLIKPGCLAPRLVCVSWAEDERSGLLDHHSGLSMVWNLLQTDDHIVFHNAPYDLGVLAAENPALLPLIFDAYQAGRVRDTMVRQKLLDVADGCSKFHAVRRADGTVARERTTYHLASLVKRRLGRELAKEGTYRLRYHELDGVPVERWPQEARDYATGDAAATLEVFLDQERELGGDPLPNEREQGMAAWALHLMSLWGVRTDPRAVEELVRRLEADVAEAKERLIPTGIYRADGTRDLAAIRGRVEFACAYLGREVPMTPTGATSTAGEHLKACAEADPELGVLAGALEAADQLSDWGRWLVAGSRAPVCARYDVLKETGRTGCSQPNMQNPPRKGSIRSCFVPRPGYLLAACDYDTLELRALAQVCLDLLGWSRMAEALRRGEDLHLSLAAQLLGISVEEAAARYAAGDPAVEEARQLCKIANFGFPGGMAARTFVEYCAGYEIRGKPVVISEGKAEELRDAWFRAWLEMREYFARVEDLRGLGDQVVQVRSGRVRGGASFCAAANGFFQGLAADGAKEALWRVARECYVDSDLGLHGSRPVVFMHDELILEVPEDRASWAAERLGQVMREAMSKWIPNVPITCKPVLMRRWYKGAKQLRVDGRLAPSRPETVDGKTVWVVDGGGAP